MNQGTRLLGRKFILPIKVRGMWQMSHSFPILREVQSKFLRIETFYLDRRYQKATDIECPQIMALARLRHKIFRDVA
jgi:hypothetical protein